MRVEKSYFTFSRGINTEANLANFPDGFTTDEVNYDLNIDGSRRRRKGLGLETDGDTIALSPTVAQGDACAAFKWEHVNNDPDINYVVIQAGSQIYFFEDTDPVSDNQEGFEINLISHKVSTSTDAQVADDAVHMDQGRGHLFIVGKHIEPLWVEYDDDNETIVVTQIRIRERDFEGIDDGVGNATQPATATDSHTYNLQNRGWKADDIATFRSSQSKEPSKAMIPWLGYRRATTANVAEVDWTKEFSPDKLVAELFQDASAPQGHFIRNPFSPATVDHPSNGNTIAIDTWSIGGTTAGTQTITVTTDGNHGLSPADEVEINGQIAVYQSLAGGVTPFYYNTFTFNGTRTVETTPTGDTFTIEITFPSDFVSWVSQYATLGEVVGDVLDAPGAEDSPYRPTTVAFFAGRVWYSGTPFKTLGSKVFFSQVIENEAQYGRCYQQADPTDERISDITDTDGGVIHIPEARQILHTKVLGAALLVYATNGVWAIGPGERGYFVATSYSVRRVSDEGAVSKHGIVIGDNIPYHTGKNDIFAIVQDENSGFLIARNLTELTVHTLYNEIPETYKANIHGVYDHLNKKVIWLYNTTENLSNYVYTKGLVFDSRLGAFTTYTFPRDSTTWVATAFAMGKAVAGDHKIKYVAITDTGTTMTIAEPNQTDFVDLDLSEQSAYIVTGYESLGDPSKFRYAPYIWVFSRKTETGYTYTGQDYVPVGESSTKLQARWNWADLTGSGKWGTEWEVYRHARLYTPSGEDDTFDNGQPVIVTRNKVRGRGRSLHLKFSAGTGKDSWILGWKTNYDIELDGMPVGGRRGQNVY